MQAGKSSHLKNLDNLAIEDDFSSWKVSQQNLSRKFGSEE